MSTAKHIPISSVMSTDLISVLPDEEIAYVHRLIRSKKIRHMLVVNPQNKLVGLLSHRDLMALPDDVYTSGAMRRASAWGPSTFRAAMSIQYISGGLWK